MGNVREYTPQEVSRFLYKIGLTTNRMIFRYNRSRGKRTRHRNPLGLFEAMMCGVLPSLKPLFTLVCEKTPHP